MSSSHQPLGFGGERAADAIRPIGHEDVNALPLRWTSTLTARNAAVSSRAGRPSAAIPIYRGCSAYGRVSGSREECR